MAGEFDEIRERLEAIAEELADLAIIRLRESIDAGGLELPVDERLDDAVVFGVDEGRQAGVSRERHGARTVPWRDGR